MTGPVWVVASAGTAKRWVGALDQMRIEALGLPWSRIVGVADPAELDAGRTPDASELVLLTSPSAVAALPPGWGTEREAACVGRTTAEAATEAGFRVTLVGPGTGEALARALVAAREPGQLLFLRGRDVRREGLAILGEAGWVVLEVIVYEARRLEDFEERLAAAAPPRAVVVGSPRGAEALAQGLLEVGRSHLLDRPTIAVGPTTAGRLRDLGFASVRVAEAPHSEGLADLLARWPETGTSP